MSEKREETRIGKWALRYRVIRRLPGGEHEDLLMSAAHDLPTTPTEANNLKKMLDNVYKTLNPARPPNLDIVGFLVHDNEEDDGGIDFRISPAGDGEGDDE